MISTAMPVLGWAESPLQLIGAAEWAAAHGRRVPLAGRLTPQMSETADELISRGALFGATEPYLGIPWNLLARHPHWLVGDGFSGQFRLAASILRPRRITFLDDGANTVAYADSLIGRRPYSRPGVVERGLTRRVVPFALEQILGRALAGQVEFFTVFELGERRSAALEDLGVRIDRHRFEWTRRTARPFSTVTGGRVLLGSARPVDGRMPLPDYLAWVRAEAALAPVTYLPHRRETPEQMAAVAAIPGVVILQAQPAGRAGPGRHGRPSRDPHAAVVHDVYLAAPARRNRQHDPSQPRRRGCRAPGGAEVTETVAVIPARGGSKGVPRKNLRSVGGVPLVARAIAAARASATVDRVVVSTDDDEIAATAEEWGAQVIQRPATLADDLASSEGVLLHALDALEAGGVEVGVLVFLQATSPFIESRDVDAAVELVADHSYDSVFSAVETYGFLWSLDAVGVADGVNHDPSIRPRRQDREPHHLETGAFYVMDAAGFRAARHRFFGRVGLVEVAERTSIEIDSEDQLALAQAIALQFQQDADRRWMSPPSSRISTVSTPTTPRCWMPTAASCPGQQIRRDGHRAAAARRHPRADPLHRDQPGRHRASPQSSRSTSGRASTTRPPRCANGPPPAASRCRRVAYLGNDVNDLACLELVGWPVAVPDAHPLVLAAARVIVSRPGGDGRGERPRRPSAPRVAPSDRNPRPHAIATHDERHSS